MAWWNAGQTPMYYGGLGGGATEEDENARRQRLERGTKTRYDVIRGGEDDPAAAQGGYLGRYTRALENLKGAGDQSRKDIRQRYAERGQEIGQDLVSRGLSGSTAGVAPRAALARAEEGSLGELDENLRQQRLSADAGLSGDILEFMGRGGGGQGGGGGDERSALEGGEGWRGKYAGTYSGLHVLGGGKGISGEEARAGWKINPATGKPELERWDPLKGAWTTGQGGTGVARWGRPPKARSFSF